jgi:hypothetical protein
MRDCMSVHWSVRSVSYREEVRVGRKSVSGGSPCREEVHIGRKSISGARAALGSSCVPAPRRRSLWLRVCVLGRENESIDIVLC